MIVSRQPLLSCEEEGCLTQETNINAEDYHIQKSARLRNSYIYYKLWKDGECLS